MRASERPARGDPGRWRLLEGPERVVGRAQVALIAEQLRGAGEALDDGGIKFAFLALTSGCSCRPRPR